MLLPTIESTLLSKFELNVGDILAVRADIQSVVDEIRQSLSLQRRHL